MMRISDFWRLMDDEFGASYARSLANSHALHELGDRTAAEALDVGIKPRTVWLALCDDMDVPAERRFGRDRRAAEK